MQEDQKFRVAIGVFDDLTKLKRALAEFRSLGLDTGQIAVLADTGALAGQLDTGLDLDQSDGKPDTPRLLIRNQPPDTKFARGNTSAKDKAALTADQLLHFEGWIASRFSDDLNDHLAQGACILISPITSARSESQISRTLLKYSVSSVQLHDIAVPG